MNYFTFILFVWAAIVGQSFIIFVASYLVLILFGAEVNFIYLAIWSVANWLILEIALLKYDYVFVKDYLNKNGEK